MKQNLICFLCILLTFISCKSNETNYTLIKDNLYTDKEGTLYLKSENKEDIENGTTHDVWLKTLYCDTCWISKGDDIIDKYELKDMVDIKTFHFDHVDQERYGAHYEDNKYTYFHKYMADGGVIILTEK